MLTMDVHIKAAILFWPLLLHIMTTEVKIVHHKYWGRYFHYDAHFTYYN